MRTLSVVTIALYYFPGLSRQITKGFDFSLKVGGLALHVLGCVDYLGVAALHAVHAAERTVGDLTQHLVLPVGT